MDPTLPPYRLDRRSLYWFGGLFGGGCLLLLAALVWYDPVRAQAAQPTPSDQPPVVTVPGSTPAPPINPAIPSQSAVPVSEVRSPAAPAHYTDQALWALIVSFLLQWVKKSQWFPWLTEQSTSRLKAQVGFVAALLTAAGIHFAVSGSVLDDGGLSITVSGLTLAALKDIAWQWAAQQAWYKLAVKE